MKSKRNRFRTLLASCLIVCAGHTAMGQENGLRLHFDFKNMNGTSVSDTECSGITASLKNEATVSKMGKYRVLDLGSGSGYLDLTEQAGELFKGMDAYSISMYYRVDEKASLSGAGFFLWTFSSSAACTGAEGKYSAYRLNAQRFANATGGYGNETAIEIGGEAAKGKWTHVVYTQDGQTGTLYLDGVAKGTNTEMPTNSSNFTTSVPYAWIGRPAFTADNYLRQTLVADVRLYDRVLETSEIGELAAAVDDLEYEYTYGNPGDFTALQNAINEAQEYIASHASSYTGAIVALYQDEVNIAQDLVNEGKVNQNAIDRQLENLASARTALEATEGFDFDVTGITTGYDTERGFRHPGALHTDADFERIREQLKAGNEKVVAAYNVLVNAGFSQSTAATNPVPTIIRGGGVGENYINAAQGASIAYQNALRWKIDGSEEHAKHAVDVLMKWARVTKGIGGDSNYALAAGLYGYAFANAAELVRDYEGWSDEDFTTFKQWMLDVWYPSCIGFLRGRNGTWQNSGKWWECPGHYWSNWGLCNVLAVMSIGILCDDVFIYNQGLSFFKYDQVGTFTDPRTSDPILNDGLTEFLGNLVVTTQESDLETGAYGKLGQMQESGRDVGHAAMAGGLAVDVAHIGWNQGDDLFSYMDHRLAAGIEYLAAQMQSVQNLPWTNYHYGTSGLHWSDGRTWIQTAPALGEQIRPYWGTVIGHYEGIKGVEMPFSKAVYEKMGIDGGGQGNTSGGYDHMGYSVLMNTRDFPTPEQIPTPLTPIMEYNGISVEHNELGGLHNTYRTEPTETLPAGTLVTLKPQLPDGTTDTGKWKWSTGENTKDLTVAADRSGIWRVTYTNENGVESEQMFSIAVEGDCEESTINPTITYNGSTRAATSINVLYNSEVSLSIFGVGGYGSYLWETGSTASSITLPHVTTSRTVSVIHTNQGGRRQETVFRINVQAARPDIIVNGGRYTDKNMMIVEKGDNVTLTATPADAMTGGTYLWGDGSTKDSLTINNVQTSASYTLDYTINGQTSTITYQIYVKETGYRSVTPGNYYIRHKTYGTYLTNHGNDDYPSFEPEDESNKAAQQWNVVNTPPSTTYGFQSVLDGTYLTDEGLWQETMTKPFRFSGAVDIETLAIQKSARSGNIYWQVAEDGSIDFAATETPNDYPFEFIPVEGSKVSETTGGKIVARTIYYSMDGKQLEQPRKGINIRQTTFTDGSVKQDKIIIR